jgi:hypothetical protein
VVEPVPLPTLLTDAEIESIILRLFFVWAPEDVRQFVASRGKRGKNASNVATASPDSFPVPHWCIRLPERLRNDLTREVRTELAWRGNVPDVHEADAKEGYGRNNGENMRVVDWIVDAMCQEELGIKKALRITGGSAVLYQAAVYYPPLALSMTTHHDRLGLRLDEDGVRLNSKSPFRAALEVDGVLVEAIAGKLTDQSLNRAVHGIALLSGQFSDVTPLNATLASLNAYDWWACGVLQALFARSNIDGSGVDVLASSDKITTKLSSVIRIKRVHLEIERAGGRCLEEDRKAYDCMEALLNDHTNRVRRIHDYRKGFAPTVRDALAIIEGPFPPPLATIVCEYGIHPEGRALAKLYGWKEAASAAAPDAPAAAAAAAAAASDT